MHGQQNSKTGTCFYCFGFNSKKKKSLKMYPVTALFTVRSVLHLPNANLLGLVPLLIQCIATLFTCINSLWW